MPPGPFRGSVEHIGAADPLGAAPDDAVLAWVSETLGARSIDKVEWMPGGSSASMHRLTVCSGARQLDTVVLRRWVRPVSVAQDPDVAMREAAMLGLVESMNAPTPRLLDCDPYGERVRVPALVMTDLPGRPVWEAKWSRWCRQLVEVLIDIHAVETTAQEMVRPFAAYRQNSYQPPRWATRPKVWERVAEIFHGPGLDSTEVFIHRGFYPGNVLWHRGQVSGVVDWEAASTGSPSIDVADCRINLFYDNEDLAHRLTSEWERATGNNFHPWADIVTIIGLLDGLREHPPRTAARSAIEDALTRAVNQLDIR